LPLLQKLADEAPRLKVAESRPSLAHDGGESSRLSTTGHGGRESGLSTPDITPQVVSGSLLLGDRLENVVDSTKFRLFY
jgi:hypothetical protein